MTGGIYEIRHRESGRYYVGRTECFRSRFRQHRSDLRCGRHHCVFLQRAWNKYGAQAFSFHIVTVCSLSEAVDIETARLAQDDPLRYNVSRMSSGGDLLRHHPDREAILTRRRASSARFMRSLSAQERIRLYGCPGEKNGMYGRTHSEESRRKMSETSRLTVKRGEDSPNYGLKRSPETRTRLSELASARSGERNSFHGRTHSAATKEKLAMANRGRTPTNSRPVQVEARRFPSVTAAARHLGVTPGLVIYRIKSPKYAYAYVLPPQDHRETL